MGFSLKGIVKGIGKVVKTVAPIAAPLLIPGVGGLVGGLASKIPGVAKAAGLASKIPGVGGIIGAVKGHGGQIMDALGAISNAQDAGRARDLEGQALGMAQQDYAAKAPLRTAGVQGMMNPVVPDMAGIGYDSPGNVYGKKKIPSVGGAL